MRALPFLILSFTLPLNLLAFPQKKKVQTVAYDCASGRRDALLDFKGDSLRYYYFGIVGASKGTIQKAAKLKVRAISGGCMITDDVKCYNEVADSLVFATRKVHLSGLR